MDLELHEKEFQDHILETILETDNASVYRMRKPGSMFFAVDVSFVAGVIVLSGDYCPGRHGVVSAGGYGRGWFSGQLSSRYLAEKFLSKGWHAENAKRWLAEKSEEHPEHAEELNELANGGNELLDNPFGFRDAVEAVLGEIDSEASPWDYDPEELAKLIVCQLVFARLWAAREAAPSREEIHG